MTTTPPPLYYVIPAMRRRSTTVVTRIASGAEVLARVDRRPDDRGHDWWYEMRGEARVPLVRYGAAAGRWAPVMWRPQVAGVWPDPLPDPIEFSIPQGPDLGAVRDGRGRPWARPADDELDPHRASDGWPHPDVPLGVPGTPPRGPREAEARLLRALRTVGFRGVVKDDMQRRTRSSDIPAELARIWERHALRERIVEAWTAGRPLDSELAAARSGWTPTRRDIGDLDAGVLSWLVPLSPLQRNLFDMRADDPPHGWRSMGRALGVDATTARGVYADAVDDLYGVALELMGVGP